MSLEGKSTVQLTPETIKNFEEARQALLNIRHMPEGGELQDLEPEVRNFLTNVGHSIAFDQKMASAEDVARAAELLKKISEAYADAAKKIEAVL